MFTNTLQNKNKFHSLNVKNQLVDLSAYSLSEIIDYISDDKKRIQITSNARKEVENHYNKNNVMKKWYDMINKIVNKQIT